MAIEKKITITIKDLKNITKKMKKNISILITVPKGFEADKIKIEVDAGKVDGRI